MAAPYVAPRAPKRVLVVVPSSDLRKQTASRFESERDLHLAGAVSTRPSEPLRVLRMTSRAKDWAELEAYDVVVALPQTISPHHYPENPPPAELFDLLVIDEAHHAPAATWRSIQSHFSGAYVMLLTATPIRRDGKRIPGELVYYYPMRLALEGGFFKPIEPRLLEPVEPGDRPSADQQIIEAAVAAMGEEQHATSTLIVRAATIKRAKELAALYEALGLEIHPLHSRLPTKKREEILAGLQDGTLRGACVVGMLGEGFDLSSIRILAYHDKHKSLPASVQLFGRLARADDAFPQESVLITVKDADVFPKLQGVVRALYDEDPDWSVVLPKIVDSEIQEEQEDLEFAKRFTRGAGELRPAGLRPLLRAIIYEVTDPDWTPFFMGGETPEGLREGDAFCGGTIILSGFDTGSRMYLLGVRHSEQPRWSSDATVVNTRYQIHLAAFVEAATKDQMDLLFLNPGTDGAHTALHELLGLEGCTRRISPAMIDDYVNGLERHSVSAIGVRNTNPAGRGTVGYRNYMGSGITRGLRAVDTNRAALGHGNLQFEFIDGESANGGFAVEKAKLWVTRYLPVRQYANWVQDTAKRLWHPMESASGKLLPGVDRGRRLEAWPTAKPLTIEMNPRTYGNEMTVAWKGEEYAVEYFDLRLAHGTSVSTTGPLSIEAFIPTSGSDEAVWSGSISAHGEISSTTPLAVKQGYRGSRDLLEVLRSHPPTIYFLDGSTAIGRLLYDNRSTDVGYRAEAMLVADWHDVDLTAETRATAARRKPPAISIHARLEEWLVARERIGVKRWVLLNDGSGEIADYIGIEKPESGLLHMSLWHAKAATGTSPSIRIDDMEKVVAQAIKSRVWFKSRRLWQELADRLSGVAKPEATLVAGSDDEAELRAWLGLTEDGDGPDGQVPWTQAEPAVRGVIAVVQPGLSRKDFISPPEGRLEAAKGISQLLTVLQDTAQAEGCDALVVGSKE